MVAILENEVSPPELVFYSLWSYLTAVAPTTV
jgi:hypothetical protein